MERNLRINNRLEEVLRSISSEMSPEEIEKKSRVQHRGRYSLPSLEDDIFVDNKITEIDNNDICEVQKDVYSEISLKNLPEGQISLFDYL